MATLYGFCVNTLLVRGEIGEGTRNTFRNPVRLAFMFIITTAAFVVTQLPYISLTILTLRVAYEPGFVTENTVEQIIRAISSLIKATIVTNGTLQFVNPLIWFAFSSAFRGHLVRMLRLIYLRTRPRGIWSHDPPVNTSGGSTQPNATSSRV